MPASNEKEAAAALIMLATASAISPAQQAGEQTSSTVTVNVGDKRPGIPSEGHKRTKKPKRTTGIPRALACLAAHTTAPEETRLPNEQPAKASSLLEQAPTEREAATEAKSYIAALLEQDLVEPETSRAR